MSILKQLNQRPIAYYPIYRQLTGSTTAGILLSQLMFWFSKKDKIFKTDSEIMEETLLTENELRSAKTKIKKLDFISVTREGIPAKTYYKIDWEKYETSLVKFTEQKELKEQTQFSEIHETNKNNNFNTETTTKTTTESNKKINKKEITYILPATVDAELFEDYLSLRETLKAPITQRAINGLIDKLIKFQSQGYNLNSIISTAYENGWKSFFVPKPQKNYRATNNTNVDFALKHNVFDIIESIPDNQNTQGMING